MNYISTTDNQSQGTIRLERKPLMGATFRDYRVYISKDRHSESFGLISPSETKFYHIPAGDYRIYVQCLPLKSNTLSIKVSPGQTLDILCTDGGFQIMAHLELRDSFFSPSTEARMTSPEQSPTNTYHFIGTNYINIEINYNEKQSLAEAASAIQQLLTQLQSQGYGERQAQQRVAQDLANQAENDDTVLGKLVKWGKSLSNVAANTIVTEGAKEVFKLALRQLGLPM